MWVFSIFEDKKEYLLMKDENKSDPSFINKKCRLHLKDFLSLKSNI